jgi:hypothetical protein
MIAILPIIIMKQAKSMFFPNLIDLVRRNKFDKNMDIEEKLRIDMVKLAKDLDSDDDDMSVRMSQGTAHRVKISQPATHETFNFKNATSEQSELQSLSEDDHALYRDDTSSLVNGTSGINATSGIGESEEDSGVSNSIAMSRSQGNFKTTKSPTFERFSGNIEEFKVKSEAMTGSIGRKMNVKKAMTMKRGKKMYGKRKFRPHMKSVKDNTIQEDNNEDNDEDNEEGSSFSDVNRKEEDKSEYDDNNTEETPSESKYAQSMGSSSANDGVRTVDLMDKSNAYASHVEDDLHLITSEPSYPQDIISSNDGHN